MATVQYRFIDALRDGITEEMRDDPQKWASCISGAEEREAYLDRLVRAGFSARRKQLHNSLRRGLDISPEATGAMLARAGIDPTRRAQTLSLAEWGGLYKESRLAVQDVPPPDETEV